MSKIRVLVVDDSVVVRRLVSGIIDDDPRLEVAGTAAHGRIALQKMTQVSPDVITLDVEMPVMDGLTTLENLRATHPDIPVIMFSSRTAQGAAVTLEALSRGATDYVAKPSTGSLRDSMAVLRSELVEKVVALAGPRTSPTVHPTSEEVPASQSSSGRTVEILAIGVSTGGPNALAELLPHLERPFPVPVVIVQHMPPMFTAMLAERLTSTTGHPVREAVGGAALEPGVFWIAPGDYHMEVTGIPHQAYLRLHQDPPENSCRPAVDPLFRSVASVYGADALGVVMTGMGQDGLLGCEHLKDHRAQVLVQDEASSVVWGMPGYVAGAGLADAICPLDTLSLEINRRVRSNRTVSSLSS